MRIRSRLIPLALALGLCAAPTAAAAKARFMRLAEVTARADLIALITVSKSQPASAKPTGAFWRYAQRNVFRVDRVIKRAPHFALKRKNQVLWARKGFICARASYAAGGYLVFLTRLPGGNWVTLNHHMGALRISGSRVPGFARHYGGTAQKLSLAEKRIQKGMLHGVRASLRATAITTTAWRRGATYQRVYLQLRWSQRTANWPTGLKWRAPALIPTRLIKAATYTSLRGRGRKATIVGRWHRGTFMISSLKP